MNNNFGDIFGTFLSLIIGGTFIDVLLKIILETPNPFLPIYIINFLELILPSLLDPMGWLFAFLWTIVIISSNKKFNIFK